MLKLAKKIFSILGLDIVFSKTLKAIKLPSGITVLIISVIPIVGVWMLGWNTFDIIILYWVENILIGVFNALKMLFAEGNSATSPSLYINSTPVTNQNSLVTKLSLTGFFAMHYGIFTIVHGVFVMTLFGPLSSFWESGNITPIFAFAIAIAISKGFSFIKNYHLGGESKYTNIGEQMFKPYGRIIVVHLSIFAIGFIAMAISVPQYAIIIFVLLKGSLDLGWHGLAHLKN